MIDITKKYLTLSGRPVTKLSLCAGSYLYCGEVDGEVVYWTKRGDDSRCRRMYQLRPEEPMIDPNKKYTSNGLPVTFIAVAGRGDWPILGYRGDNDSVQYWQHNGCSSRGDFYTLMPVKEKKTGWLVSHTGGIHGWVGSVYETREDAISCAYNRAHNSQIAIKVEWEE